VVVVPAQLGASRAGVLFPALVSAELRRSGLDAELSDRAIDLDFSGLLGSPVGPGTTTSRSISSAPSTRACGRAQSVVLRPHLGCVPLAAAATAPSPTGSCRRVPTGQPTIRRVRTCAACGSNRARCRVPRRERLISGWHAIGFYTARAERERSARADGAATQSSRGEPRRVRVRGAAVRRARDRAGRRRLRRGS
jgi:hypothetical protein